MKFKSTKFHNVRLLALITDLIQKPKTPREILFQT